MTRARAHHHRGGRECVVLAIAAIAAISSIASIASIAAAAPPDAPDTFVLIATNNRSLEPGRPPLRYADDDGAKYHALFRTAVPPERIRLLTELDRDTAQLFPELTGAGAASIRPPTRAALTEAAAALGREVAAARRAGRATQLYVIYAGHGDLDGGRGYVELADGRLYSEELERLLLAIGAARSHVILDSCNSFFVLNARRPGGRRFATPEDAARNLSVRLPDVGVFLSTSAEAEVYEWSQLQSGIFSHAVRSGLAGGADANGDGAVSYEELAAFVEVAAAGVRNHAFRPKVFARGPRGDNTAPIFAASPARAARLQLGGGAGAGSGRLTIRDRSELPWFDVHPEPASRLTLWLPAERLAGGVAVEHAPPGGPRPAGTGPVRRALGSLLAGGIVPWSGLAEETAGAAPAPSTTATRGAGELFHDLFSRPFGPRALAAYREARRREPAPVFGIAAADARELGLLLAQMRADSRRSRLLGTSALLGVGLAAVGAGLWYGDRHPDQRGATYAIVGVGAAAAIGGGLGLLLPADAERLAADFAAGAARGEDPSLLVGRTAERLERIRRDYRRTRRLQGWLGVGLVAAGAAGLAVEESRDLVDRAPSRMILGGAIAAGAWMAVTSRLEFPIERMSALWAAQPAVRRFSLTPLPGGAAVGLGGSL